MKKNPTPKPRVSWNIYESLQLWYSKSSKSNPGKPAQCLQQASPMLIMHFTEESRHRLPPFTSYHTVSLFTYLFVVCFFFFLAFWLRIKLVFFLLTTLPVKGQLMQEQDNEGGLVNTDVPNVPSSFSWSKMLWRRTLDQHAPGKRLEKKDSSQWTSGTSPFSL